MNKPTNIHALPDAKDTTTTVFAEAKAFMDANGGAGQVVIVMRCPKAGGGGKMHLVCNNEDNATSISGLLNWALHRIHQTMFKSGHT